MSIPYVTQDYSVLSRLCADKKVMIICDENSAKYCLPRFSEQLEHSSFHSLVLPPGESSKSLDCSQIIWDQLLEHRFSRNDILIGLGGGMITDLIGWIATTYKRGMLCALVPTTVLGAVDASIGGKNGINYAHLKNQIGTFNIPDHVLIDPIYFESLDHKTWYAGFAEMIKHALISSQDDWQKLQNHKSPRDTITTQDILSSMHIKHAIVEQDFKESGIRKALNFGHTIGHALESYFLQTDTPLLHGEAVAYGMLLEIDLSVWQSDLDPNLAEEIKAYISNLYTLPRIPDHAIEDIIAYMHHDKKNTADEIKAVLLSAVGHTRLNESLYVADVKRAIASYI